MIPDHDMEEEKNRSAGRKDDTRIIVVVPMTERLTAESLRYSEIKGITGMLRSAGENGIGYAIRFGTMVGAVFTITLFKE